MNVYNYNHLFYFYVTAKLNGVTEAARHLNTSQSSLSTQINTLESILGKNLFKKVGRRMELTDSGKEIFGYCRRAFDTFDEMFDQMEKKLSSMGVRVSVGVATDIERPYVTDILGKVAKQYKKGQQPLINLVSLPTPQLLQLLKVGDLDLLLTTKATIDNEFEILNQFDLSVNLYASQDIAEDCQGLSPEEIVRNKDLPFVLPSRLTSLRAEIDDFFLKKKVNPVCVFESNIMASVVRASIDGLGVALLPLAYVYRELRSEKLIQLNSKPLWKHKIILLSSKRHLEPERQQFADNLIEHINLSLR